MANQTNARGGGGAPPSSKRGKAQGGNTGNLVLEQWDLNVRYYKLTSSDIILLGFLGTIGSLLLTAGGAAFGFFMNIKMSLAFVDPEKPLAPAAIVFRETWEPISFWAGMIFIGLGLIFLFSSVIRFYFIKRNHVLRTGDATI